LCLGFFTWGHVACYASRPSKLWSQMHNWCKEKVISWGYFTVIITGDYTKSHHACHRNTDINSCIKSKDAPIHLTSTKNYICKTLPDMYMIWKKYKTQCLDFVFSCPCAHVSAHAGVHIPTRLMWKQIQVNFIKFR